jgi:DNA-binding GntR family transcriptional regulator
VVKVLTDAFDRRGYTAQATALKLQTWLLDREPGISITEGDVASRWGVSRPTAKNAIDMLVYDGFLRREPNKPAYLPKITEADVVDLFGARIPLELEIVRRVAAQQDVPQPAAFHVFAMGQFKGNEPIHTFVEVDLGFHLALLESVDSPRLTRLYRVLQGEIHLTMVQSRRVLGASRVHDEHGSILEACRHGNLETAEKMMFDHLNNACEEIAKKLKAAEEGAAVS